MGGDVSIGVTGSRHGGSTRQVQILREVLVMLGPERLILNHGDCVGFDQQAHNLACELGVGRIMIHPPMNPIWRAHCVPRPSHYDRVMSPLDYHTRDITIVYASLVLIAAPQKPENEATRSGTWFTIRKAHDRGIPVITLPRGNLSATPTKDGAPNE
jgi:hypothetical protein